MSANERVVSEDTNPRRGARERATPREALEALEPSWPDSNGRPIVFLLDASSPLERRVLESWIDRRAPDGVEPADYEIIAIPASRKRRRKSPLDPHLEAALASDTDPLLAPLRIAWLPPLRDGTRQVHFSDLLTLGDPRDPTRIRQHWIKRRDPERCRIVAGAPAPASELRLRWRDAGGTDTAQTLGLAEFVARQAALSLERGERRLRGARYKVPRLVHEEILGRPAFRAGLARLARESGRSEQSVTREAQRILREIAATHSPFVIDLVSRLIHLIYRQGYSEALLYDHEQLGQIAALAQQNPVVFLPTHKSNLDHLVLQYALHENGLPPNHTAGGINMNFFPVGPLVRRSGVFFIRRSFKDNEIYKHVLRSYIDYLVEKRFSLEWYIEGGRSRSGKLLPPRFGMLAYVVDAYRRGKSDDVFLIPVSIAYDQIQEAGTYAAEQGGAAKTKESFGWFIGFVRALRRRYGSIYIRFGEPVSLRTQLVARNPGAEPDPDERTLDLQKLAFETSVRINRVTPVTPVSLVTLALLGTGDRALSVAETRNAISNLVYYVQERKLPTTHEMFHLETDEGVRETLEALVENGVASRYDGGPETVYAITPEQQLAAAYYRNTIVHFFVNSAICELALLAATEDRGADQQAVFWHEAMRLRDLLKFEFFFAEKDEYRAELREELSFQDPNWEEEIGRGSESIQALAQRMRPFSSHRVLRPFLESYQVVAEVLVHCEPSRELGEAQLMEQCLGLGKQYVLQHRIRSAASVSKVLFDGALKLAANRGLFDSNNADLLDRRRDFRAELAAALRRVDAIDALAASRRVGLIP
jgi:glycerol-3-phosphate O-acyltransferase